MYIFQLSCCSEVRTGGTEVRRRRAETDLQRCRLKSIKPLLTEQYNKWVKQNPVIPAYRVQVLQGTITDKDMGGNRGLNTQHVTDGIGTICDGRQDKTNGK